MAVVAIVGTFNDQITSPIVGNGKSLCMTYYLHEDKFKSFRDIYTNYKTTFSTKLGIMEIFNRIKEGEIQYSSIGIDEMPSILNSLGSRAQNVLFSEKIIGQLRKYDDNFYYTAQRFFSVQNRIRILTSIILEPHKIHEDLTACYEPNCKREHLILVYSWEPFKEDYIKCLIASKVGLLYDTNEFINDEMNVITAKDKETIRKELERMKHDGEI